MNFKVSRNLMWASFVIGIVLFAIAIGLDSQRIYKGLALAGIVVYLVGFIQAVIFYNCPRCGRSLMDVRGGIPPFCPKCGEPLREEKE